MVFEIGVSVNIIKHKKECFFDKIERKKDKSYSNIKRLQYKIKVNANELTHKEVLSICNEYIPKAIIFHVYLNGREINDIANYILEWAPDGDWGKADSKADFKRHQLKITSEFKD